MSASNGTGAGAKGPPKGEDKKDDTIVKIAGVAIATGIAYSLYKSVFVGKKTEEPVHEQICVEKPEGLSKFEAGVKEKAGEFKAGAKEFKGAVDEKGRQAKSAAEEKGKELREAVEEGEKKAGEQEKKTEQQWRGWFSWLGGQANKEKEEVEAEAEEAKKTVADGAKSAEKKGNKFLDKADDEIIKTKDGVEKGFAAAEAKVEKTGAAVIHKAHKPSHGGKPKKGYKEYDIVSGDTLWSISRKYGVTIGELKSANGIWNEDFIVAGDSLTIPK